MGDGRCDKPGPGRSWALNWTDPHGWMVVSPGEKAGGQIRMGIWKFRFYSTDKRKPREGLSETASLER